jgi:hypothetical protein
MKPREGPESDVRSRLVRQVTIYTATFFAAAVAVAIVGAALVAWLLRFAGQPFLRTWLVLTLVIVLPGLLAALWKLIRLR